MSLNEHILTSGMDEKWGGWRVATAEQATSSQIVLGGGFVGLLGLPHPSPSH